MKQLVLSFALVGVLAGAALAGDLPYLKKGDRVELKAVESGALPAGALTIVQLGSGEWVQVEYERTSGKAGESGLKTEKAQLWVNFAHVVTCRVLPVP